MNKKQQKLEDWYLALQGLSTRARNVLWNANVSSTEKLRSLFERGQLHPGVWKQRNYGWKTYRELCVFLGEEAPIKKAKSVCSCCKQPCAYCHGLIHLPDED